MYKNKMLIAVVFIMVLFILSCGKNSEEERDEFPVAENGVIDISKWSEVKSNTLALGGVWEFYWNQLLTPSNFDEGKVHDGVEYLEIGKSWTEYEIQEHTKLPAYGYATYRLTIKDENPED